MLRRGLSLLEQKHALKAPGRQDRVRFLMEWNDTATAYPHRSGINELFEAQVQRTPDSIALVFGGEQITYGELNRRSNQLAHFLRKLGVARETRVAVCLERSPLMIVA